MAENIEQFRVHLPEYLTLGQKSEVLKALSSFPDKINYYTPQFPNDMLQGDGWRGLEVLEFESGARKPRKGIILSNTCDIDPANK